jgi:hypothetical protein
MRVEITRVLDPSEGRVAFRCAVGHASGCWAGSAPARLGEFDVELEIPEDITQWTVLDAPAPGSIAGGVEGDPSVSITGTVVDIGEGDDPIVGVRLGPDIILIEAPDRKWEITPGDVVSLRVSVVRLYPYQL